MRPPQQSSRSEKVPIAVSSRLRLPVSLSKPSHSEDFSSSLTASLKEKPEGKPEEKPVLDITVVIPTYNSEKRLPKVLDLLSRQTDLSHVRWEILVCDNGSTDDTAAVVRRYQKKWSAQSPLHYRFAAKQGAASARQLGVESARGELIAFLDDDNLPSQDWLVQAYRFAEAHPQAGAFGSQIHGKFETKLPSELKNIQCFLAIIERGDQPHRYEPATKILPPAAGLVVRTCAWLNSVPAQLFLNNKGKAAGLASEDLEAILHIQKSGWEVWYNPDMVIHHDIPDGRLRKDYLTTLFRCVGLSRFHIRLLGLESWKYPFAIPAYIANDIRKLALHRMRYGRQAQLSTVESCQRVLLTSTVASPVFLLQKVCSDTVQSLEDRAQSDREQKLSQIAQAFEQDCFALYQQPVVDVEIPSPPKVPETDAINLSVPGQKEILLRLIDRQNQCILPHSFLPTAERYGLMRVIDRWVIRHLFDQVAQESRCPEFTKAVVRLQDSPLYSINLSLESVKDDTLLDFIAHELAKVNLPASQFCFEIAITTAIALPHSTRDLVEGLHRLKCQVTLDDVVLSPKVVSIIDRLPLNYIKLSPTLADNRQLQNSNLWSQLRTTMQEQSVQAIAKGVESQAILEAMQARGIRYAQGYQIGRPQPLSLQPVTD